MHVIVGMWGILRSLPYTVDSIHEFCLTPLRQHGYTFEIFMHTYSLSEPYTNFRNGEKGIINSSSWKLLDPDYIFVEDQDVFDKRMNYADFEISGDSWKNGFLSLKNHVRALNSLFHLTQMIESASNIRKIDSVIFLRPDVTIISELPVYLLSLFPNNTLFVPDFHRSCVGNEYNDRMAMGDLRAAVVYGSRLKFAVEYSRMHKLHSERFLYYYLNYVKYVNVAEIPFRFKRTRMNGKIAQRDKGIIGPEDENTYILHRKAPRTVVWYLQIFYSLNHYDYNSSNIFCSPNHRISYKTILKYKMMST